MKNDLSKSRRTGIFGIFFLRVHSCTVRAQSRLYKGWTTSLKTTSLEIEVNIPRIRRTGFRIFFLCLHARSCNAMYKGRTIRMKSNTRTFERDLDSKYFKKLFRGLKVDTFHDTTIRFRDKGVQKWPSLFPTISNSIFPRRDKGIGRDERLKRFVRRKGEGGITGIERRRVGVGYCARGYVLWDVTTRGGCT